MKEIWGILSYTEEELEEKDGILDMIDDIDLGFLDESPEERKARIKKFVDELYPKRGQSCTSCQKKLKCTCGAEKVGSSIHSDWCDKAKKG